MSTKYKFSNPDALYFVTFATIGWIDILTRIIYKEILLDSFRYCIKEKGLRIHSYVIMSNHVHMIISRRGEPSLSDIMRDMKKFSSVKIIKAIIENPQESRKKWILYLLSQAGKANSNNTYYQLWQQDNHPIELSPNTDLFTEKLNYIHQNPVTSGWVSEASAYLYSSASNYEDKGAVFNEIEVVY